MLGFKETMIWASPAIWADYGEWVKIYEVTGRRTLDIDFSSMSDIAAGFSIEIVVGSIRVGSRSQVTHLEGPISYKVRTPNIIGGVYARCRSHFTGQLIKAIVH